MRRHIRAAWLVAALAATGAAGCQDTAGHTYPADPLFAGKKPIEAKSENTAPVAVVCQEPAIPPVPARVLATYQQIRSLPDPFPSP